jgi:hypothetical protein
MGSSTTIMTLYPTQAAPTQPLRGTSTRTNFERIAWTRYRAAKPGIPAEGRSIQLQTFVDANGPRRRSINIKGTVTEMSVSDLMDEIRSITQITYSSDVFEFAEAFSKHLEYGLSNSHCTTIVSGLKDSGGTYRGEIVIPFGPR